MDPYQLFKVFNEPAEFVCPLSHRVMLEPVNVADGFCYDKAAIEAHLKKSGLSPISNSPLAHRNLSPNQQLKQTIEAYRNEVFETCSQLAAYYKDVSPQDALNLLLRVKKVMGEAFFTHEAALSQTVDIGELVIRYADSITPDQQRQAGIDEKFLHRMKAAAIEPLIEIYRKRGDNQNLSRIRQEAGKTFVALQELGTVERILLKDMQLNNAQMWGLLPKIQQTLGKKREAARSFLLYADWLQQNGQGNQVQATREEAFKLDPALRNQPNASALPPSGDMNASDVKANKELREQLKAALIRDLKATPGDEGLAQNLVEFFDFEGDALSCLTLALAKMIAVHVQPPKANDASLLADYIATIMQTSLEFYQSAVDALVEENKGLKGSGQPSELVNQVQQQRDVAARNQAVVQELATLVRGTVGAPAPKPFKPPAPLGTFKQQLSGQAPEEEAAPARPMVNLGAPSPLGVRAPSMALPGGLPGAAPRNPLGLPPVGGAGLPPVGGARNPIGLPPVSATGANNEAPRGMMTFSVESGTQEQPQEEPARPPMGMPRPGSGPALPGMGGGAAPPGLGGVRSMNFGRSPLGPPEQQQPQEDSNSSGRPPSGGAGLPPMGGLKKFPMPGGPGGPIGGPLGGSSTPPPGPNPSSNNPPSGPNPMGMPGRPPLPGGPSSNNLPSTSGMPGGPGPMGMPGGPRPPMPGGPSSFSSMTPPGSNTNNSGNNSPAPPSLGGPPRPLGGPLGGSGTPPPNPGGMPGGSNPPNPGGMPGSMPGRMPMPGMSGMPSMPGGPLAGPMPGGNSSSNNNNPSGPAPPSLGGPPRPLGSSMSTNNLPSFGGMPPSRPSDNNNNNNNNNPPNQFNSNPPPNQFNTNPNPGGYNQQPQDINNNNNPSNTSPSFPRPGMPPMPGGLRPPLMPLGGGDNSDVVIGLPPGALGTNNTSSNPSGPGGMPGGVRPPLLPGMSPLPGGPPRPLSGSGSFSSNPPSVGSYGGAPNSPMNTNPNPMGTNPNPGMPGGMGGPPRPGGPMPGMGGPPQPLGGSPMPGMSGMPGGPPRPGGFPGSPSPSPFGGAAPPPSTGGYGSPQPPSLGGYGQPPNMGGGMPGGPPRPMGGPMPGGYGAPPPNFGGSAPPNFGGAPPPNFGGSAPPNFGGAPPPGMNNNMTGSGGLPPMRPPMPGMMPGMMPKFPMTPPGQ